MLTEIVRGDSVLLMIILSHPCAILARQHAAILCSKTVSPRLPHATLFSSISRILVHEELTIVDSTSILAKRILRCEWLNIHLRGTNNAFYSSIPLFLVLSLYTGRFTTAVACHSRCRCRKWAHPLRHPVALLLDVLQMRQIQSIPTANVTRRNLSRSASAAARARSRLGPPTPNAPVVLPTHSGRLRVVDQP